MDLIGVFLRVPRELIIIVTHYQYSLINVLVVTEAVPVFFFTLKVRNMASFFRK